MLKLAKDYQMAFHTTLGPGLRAPVSPGFTAPLACGFQSFHIYNFKCGIAPLLAQGFHTTFKPRQTPFKTLDLTLGYATFHTAVNATFGNNSVILGHLSCDVKFLNQTPGVKFSLSNVKCGIS